MSEDMKELIGMLVGVVTIPLLILFGTVVGTAAFLTTTNSLWKMLVFITWPFIAAVTVAFVLLWDER